MKFFSHFLKQVCFCYSSRNSIIFSSCTFKIQKSSLLIRFNNSNVFSKRFSSSIFSLRDSPYRRPLLLISQNAFSRISNLKHSWIFNREVLNRDKLAPYSPCIVNVEDEAGHDLGVAIYNRHSSISARIMSFNRYVCMDEHFFYERLRKALEFRQQICADNFYRLVHAESDNLPGVIVDRYDNIICLQINVSGMDLLLNFILKAINQLLDCQVIILRNDSQVRKLEKLPLRREVIKGEYKSHAIIRENGLVFMVDVLEGQKTGWFFDQKLNRIFFTTNFCKNKYVLDLFSYVGAFGIQAAAFGAKKVVCVESSGDAVSFGKGNIKMNHLEKNVFFLQCDVIKFLDTFKGKESNSRDADSHEYKNNEQWYSIDKHEESGASAHKGNQRQKRGTDRKEEEEEEGEGSHLLHSSSSSVVCPNDTLHGKVTLTSFSRKEPIYNLKSKKSSQSSAENFFHDECSVELSDFFHDEDFEKLPQQSDIDSEEEDVHTQIDLIKSKTTDLFDVIIIDPPPLARHSSLIRSALRIYEQLVFKAGRILSSNGVIFLSSCSKCIGKKELTFAALRAFKWLNRECRILHTFGASSDHPVHMSISQTEYLTALVLHVR